MPSIGVLEHNQKPTERPSRRIKKAGGQSLVNRGMAFWLIENVLLIMRRPAEVQLYANSHGTHIKSTPNRDVYIPDHLPWNIDKMLGVIVVGIPRNVRNPWEIQP